MDKIIECVPNFSEGRRPEVVEAIVDEIRQTPGAILLDYPSDADHNRTVVTFVGGPEAVAEAAFRACKKASELINMEEHRGAHPRMGATDVIPFIPIAGTDMKECAAIAHRVAKRIAEELGIPTYLYEQAAQRPDRVNLADVRRGEYEGLRELISTPERQPDYGPARMHPTAGATAVGARMPLVAYNINLGTSDMSIGKKIAKAVRGSSGGLVFVKAMAVELKERQQVQISMNLVNYIDTPIHRAFELVKLEAERYGVPVVGSEIVGLVPMNALIGVARHYLRLEEFKSNQVLETRIR